MVEVVFYAKPGCQGNARQMQVLQSAGHHLVVRNLLSEPWTEERLRGFFGARPPAEWFNRSAVRVKSGEVDPDALTETEAMALLLADPALIRRPLIEAEGQQHAGWEPTLIADWIGLGDSMSPGKEGCAAKPATSTDTSPPTPDAADCRQTSQSR